MGMYIYESTVKDTNGQQRGTIYGFVAEKDSSKLPSATSHGGSDLTIAPWVFSETIDQESTLPRWLTVPKNRISEISTMVRAHGWAMSWYGRLISAGEP